MQSTEVVRDTSHTTKIHEINETKIYASDLQVNLNVFADHVTTNKDNHAEIIPNQPPATDVPTICRAQSFRQTEIDIDGNTSSIDMKYHRTTQANNFGICLQSCQHQDQKRLTINWGYHQNNDCM